MTALRSALPPAGSLGAWFLAIRPKTLPAAVAPVAVGTACAHTVSSVRWGPAIGALLGALLLQILANLANDVFDFEKGADSADRLGPARVVQSQLLSPKAVRAGMAVTTLLALGVGIYLWGVSGPVSFAMGCAALLAALAYTGGPFPLGYHGLGEVFVILFFGFVAVPGTAFVQALSVPLLAWWCAIPVGALAAALLVVNNIRDLGTDQLAGKRTLAVRFGRPGANLEYVALLAVAYAVPGSLVLSRVAGGPVLLPFLSLPLAAWLALCVPSESGRVLNKRLAQTAGLLLLFSLLLAAGLALDVVLRALPSK